MNLEVIITLFLNSEESFNNHFCWIGRILQLKLFLFTINMITLR